MNTFVKKPGLSTPILNWQYLSKCLLKNNLKFQKKNIIVHQEKYIKKELTSDKIIIGGIIA